MLSKLVTFEGIDGSGKSTLAKETFRRLKAKGIEAILTAEPTDGWLGNIARRGLEEDLDPFAQALLFLADRAHHSRALRAWLTEGKVVLCDRYVDSTLAYQGAALEGKISGAPDWLRRVGTPFTRNPDLTFLLILDPSEALSRVAHRPRTRLEDASFLAEVQERYRALARDRRFVELDATRSPEDLATQVVGIMEKRFPARPQ